MCRESSGYESSPPHRYDVLRSIYPLLKREYRRSWFPKGCDVRSKRTLAAQEADAPARGLPRPLRRVFSVGTHFKFLGKRSPCLDFGVFILDTHTPARGARRSSRVYLCASSTAPCELMPS